MGKASGCGSRSNGLAKGSQNGHSMVVVVDTVSATPLRPRHPEKVNRPDALSPPKPDWIRVRAPNSRGYADTRQIVKENGLVTVCEEAGCPNIGECWDKKHATFMIMGDTCTRACAFCNVKTGMPGALDALEPEHVAEATFKLGLAHIVITSVDRDDLADGGAAHFAETIGARGDDRKAGCQCFEAGVGKWVVDCRKQKNIPRSIKRRHILNHTQKPDAS